MQVRRSKYSLLLLCSDDNGGDGRCSADDGGERQCSDDVDGRCSDDNGSYGRCSGDGGGDGCLQQDRCVYAG